MDNFNKKVLVCEDSFEGILSCIYDAWVVMNQNGKDNVAIVCGENYNMELFMEYVQVEKNREKSFKVAESIKRKMSFHIYNDIYRTAVSDVSDKADLIFRYLQHGFRMGRRVSECLAIPEIMEVTKISKNVLREYDHLRGFLRFGQITENVLSAEIEPKNDILDMLGNHFSDRLSSENFIIKDMGRKKTLVHKQYCDYYIINNMLPDTGDNGVMSGNEGYYEELWKVFFETIAIDSRKNYELQRNNLPLRFRKYMTEFDKFN
ncbi:MAG: DNA metabolism protein [Lachnospiraceae bacterium]|nr:DNA metabolism protein [Lachnospiraceae bacterium]